MTIVKMIFISMILIPIALNKCSKFCSGKCLSLRRKLMPRAAFSAYDLDVIINGISITPSLASAYLSTY